NSKSVLAGITLPALKKKLIGKKIKSVSGYGKFLFAQTNDNEYLAMHFGMTGFLNYYKNKEEAGKYIRFQIDLENVYQFGFVDRRKIGHMFFSMNHIK